MALVDQLTDHRQYLASVLERQECRRRRVNAGGYSAQPVLGAAGPSSSRHGNGSLRTPSESESSRAGPSSLPDSGRSVASSRLDSQYVPRRALDSTGSSARQPSDDTPRAPSPTPSKRNVANYIPAEEAVRNDYAAWYGVSGDWPSNYVLGAGSEEICEE